MGEADTIQSYTPFKPLKNRLVSFKCVGFIKLDTYHNKRYKPKNIANYVELGDDVKVIEEAPMYRITVNGDVISTYGHHKVLRPFYNYKSLYVQVKINDKKKNLMIDKLMKKYYPDVELKPQSHD